jgi:hypothetical protein
LVNDGRARCRERGLFLGTCPDSERASARLEKNNVMGQRKHRVCVCGSEAGKGRKRTTGGKIKQRSKHAEMVLLTDRRTEKERGIGVSEKTVKESESQRNLPSDRACVREDETTRFPCLLRDHSNLRFLHTPKRSPSLPARRFFERRGT